MTPSCLPSRQNKFSAFGCDRSDIAFEINVRASTVLGYIGAGGIGLNLQQTLQVFNYAQTGTIIIVIIVVVVLIDYVSSKSREALMR